VRSRKHRTEHEDKDRVVVSWRSASSNESCRSNSISDRVSIRGFREVTSFRPGKSIEVKPETFNPPLFERAPMSVFQRLYLSFSRSAIRCGVIAAKVLQTGREIE